MRKFETYARNLVLAAAVALTVSACVVVPARGYYAGGGYYTGAVTIAPPEPQVEVYGAPPVAGYVWIGGYWNWVNGRHVWSVAVGPRRARDIAGRPTTGNTGVMAGTWPAAAGCVAKPAALRDHVARWLVHRAISLSLGTVSPTR